MYGRDYGNQTLNFEASGGLSNASLVMQDKQTDTYWSIMKGAAVAGKLKGESLKVLPVGEKVTWKQWREQHPETKLLSVNSEQDGRNPFRLYFRNEEGFRGLHAEDDRLKTKSPIFAFHHDDENYAVPYSEFESGQAFILPGGDHVFLFRHSQDKLFRSTVAYISQRGFTKQDNHWVDNESGSQFDEAKRQFSPPVELLRGFDTFWYNWSLNNPDTELLTKPNDDKTKSGPSEK